LIAILLATDAMVDGLIKLSSTSKITLLSLSLPTPIPLKLVPASTMQPKQQQSKTVVGFRYHLQTKSNP